MNLLSFVLGILLGGLLLALPIAHKPDAQIDLLETLFTVTSALCVMGWRRQFQIWLKIDREWDGFS